MPNRALTTNSTVKSPGMFATSIIILPSYYQGGQVHVAHAKKSQIFDFSASSHLSTSLLSWYTDVHHEVMPVTAGYRLALSFNVIQTKPSANLPNLALLDEAKNWLRRILLKWNKDRYTESPGTVAVYILNHQYSAMDLRRGAAALKGRDKGVFMCLRSVADETDHIVTLANVVYHQSGSPVDDGAEYYYSRNKRRRYGWDESESEDEEDQQDVSMEEVHDEDLSLDNIVDIFGTELSQAKVNIEMTDIIPANYFEEADPDDKEYEGYMGNVGLPL